MKRDFHPVSEVFPLMHGKAFDDLIVDIRANGLREPIWIHRDGRIIDGRNRYRACEASGIEPETRVFDGDDSELVPFVVSLNLHRRHLDASQMAMVRAKAEAIIGHGGDRRSDDFKAQNCALKSLADQIPVHRNTVGYARGVLADGAPELVRAVERGDVKVSAAAILSELPKDAQAEVLAGGREEVAATVKAMKAHVGHATGDNEWYTPVPYIDAARATMGRIDCDPASSDIANATVQAKTYHTAETNGLMQPWGSRVWMNPPYAQPLISDFCSELIKRIDAGEVKQACVLVNNATETAWGQQLIGRASAVCFPRGRVRFIAPDGKPSGAPLQGQMVVYFGSNADSFIEAFSELGIVLWTPPIAA